MTRFLTISFALSCTVFISACERSQPPPLPQGQQEVTGVLFPAEISIVRRGSHVLMQKESPLYYVESSKVNLRAYEQKQVMLTGKLEYNIDPFDLPVLVTETVELLTEEVRSWSFPQFGLTLSTPQEWISSPVDEGVHFLVEGSDKPVLTIFMEEYSEETESQGFPVVIGGNSALRDINEETGAETIRFERGAGVLVLLFTPREHPRSLELKSQWLSILQTLTLDSAGETSTDMPATGTGSGVPCGGPAGVLCPSGYFCDIQNLQENIGVCKKI